MGFNFFLKKDTGHALRYIYTIRYTNETSNGAERNSTHFIPKPLQTRNR